VAAYADQRAYTDRLNELFTPAGWTREYTVQVVQNFERGKDNRVIAAKVMVACRLTIFGLGSHSGTGEEWADDQNALTRAEAQAFKRACVCFGLGRYFYDLPRTWVDLDDRKRPLQLPQLPAWALPHRSHGSSNGAAGTGGGRRQTGGNGRTSVGTIDAGKQGGLMKQIEDLSQQIGRGLTAYVVRSVAGVEEVEQVAAVEKLTTIAARMENAARGVGRLKKATDLVGAETHAALCDKLQLPSNALDDIPDTRVLRVLVERLEEQARSKTLDRPSAGRGRRTAQEKPERQGNESGQEFEQLRGCLLAEARRVSTAIGIGMTELVAKASGGAFQFGDIATLAEADRAKVEAALAAVRKMHAQQQAVPGKEDEHEESATDH